MADSFAKLPEEDRAFIELMVGLHRQLDSMKAIFPKKTHQMVIAALQ